MESMGVVVWRYIDFLILLIPTPLVSALFGLLFLFILKIRFCSGTFCNLCNHFLCSI